MKSLNIELREPSASFSTPFDDQGKEEYQSLFKSMRKREIFASVLSLFGSTFGIGSLGLPAMMIKVGPLSWFLLLATALGINYITFEAMINFAEKLGFVNLVDLATILGNRKTYVTILVLFVLSTIFRLLSAMAVFNGLICSVTEEFGVSNIYFIAKQSLMWVLIPSIALFPVLIKKKLKSLAVTTFISLGSAFYIIAFLAYSYFVAGSEPVENPKDLSSWTNIPTAYGFMLTATACQSNLMAIYKELTAKSVVIMRKIIWIHLGLFVFIYSCFATFGYLLFNADERILTMPFLELFTAHKGVFLLIANLLMIIASLNSFVFGFKPLKDTLLKLLEGEPETLEEQKQPNDNDFDPLNLTLTMALLCFFLGISGIFTLNDIGFLQILTFSSNFIVPILFTFIPLAAAIKTQNSKIAIGAAVVAGSFYLWKVMDLVIPMISSAIELIM